MHAPCPSAARGSVAMMPRPLTLVFVFLVVTIGCILLSPAFQYGRALISGLFQSDAYWPGHFFNSEGPWPMPSPPPFPGNCPDTYDILDSALDSAFGYAPVPNEELSLLRSLRGHYSGPNTRHVALTGHSEFPLQAFLAAQGVHVNVRSEPNVENVFWQPGASELSAMGFSGNPFDGQGANEWADGKRDPKGALVPHIPTGVLRFRYLDTDFTVYKISWNRVHMQKTLYDFVFDIPYATPPLLSQDAVKGVSTVGHMLISEVYRWSSELRDEMWVFQEGQWIKDRALWTSIRNATWDDLVLEQELLEGLKRDTRTFFENRAIYKELGVTWKRGILLLGPPGNGKTESIKVVLKESGQTALYVKSFTTMMGAEDGIHTIFQHARANAPCILVIEDLDSMVTPDARSYFLNELDGIAQNEGILTIATTNHPERIDDAILNRPSRFDVKYDFALPSEDLRIAYSLKWIRKMTTLSTADASLPSMYRVSFDKDEIELAREIAAKTEGFSFAFMKELFISFLLRLAHDKTQELSRGVTENLYSADSTLLKQAEVLSKQILKTAQDEARELSQNMGDFRMDGFYPPHGFPSS